MQKLTIGVLALQGAFARHMEAVRALGAKTQPVRFPHELDSCDALIVPGGESTTMCRQIDYFQLWEPLQSFAQERPLFGTCAGLILMAREEVQKSVPTMNLIDVVVARNAYGRQTESFISSLDWTPSKAPLEAVFIRAPRIRETGSRVEVLAELDGEPVLVRQGLHLAASFHPELTKDYRLHELFLDSIVLVTSTA